MSKLCLNMIVKNEEAIIERCLRSVAPHVDYAVILDTGSEDNTVATILDTLLELDIRHEVHYGQFVNFGQARNDALDHARASYGDFDYILFADADMELVVEDQSVFEDLNLAAYHVNQRNGDLSYNNIRLLSREVEANYVGVTHEYLDVTGETGVVYANAAHFVDHANGSNRADKFVRDASLLAAALVEDPDNARYMFYLAQSLRDAGQLGESMVAYGNRVGMGGWGEEVYYSALQIASLGERTGQDWKNVVQSYLDAWNFRPSRAEPLIEASRILRSKGRFAQAWLYAETAAGLSRPNDILFVDESAYAWRALDELALASYYAGEKDISAAACRQLLLGDKLPDSERGRVMTNLGFAAEVYDA